MGKRFSANGDYVDFASLELGILGLTRLPNELSAVNFGDSISRADIEGTGQVPLGQARGRYKCDNIQIKCTLEAAKEIYDKLAEEAQGRGARSRGSVKTVAVVSVQCLIFSFWSLLPALIHFQFCLLTCSAPPFL